MSVWGMALSQGPPETLALCSLSWWLSPSPGDLPSFPIYCKSTKAHRVFTLSNAGTWVCAHLGTHTLEHKHGVRACMYGHKGVRIKG